MAEAKHFYMPLFKPGTQVRCDGKKETVSHVLLRRNLMFVHLVGHKKPIDSELVDLEPSLFTSGRIQAQSLTSL